MCEMSAVRTPMLVIPRVVSKPSFRCDSIRSPLGGVEYAKNGEWVKIRTGGGTLVGGRGRSLLRPDTTGPGSVSYPAASKSSKSKPPE